MGENSSLGGAQTRPPRKKKPAWKVGKKGSQSPHASMTSMLDAIAGRAGTAVGLPVPASVRTMDIATPDAHKTAVREIHEAIALNKKKTADRRGRFRAAVREVVAVDRFAKGGRFATTLRRLSESANQIVEDAHAKIHLRTVSPQRGGGADGDTRSAVPPTGRTVPPVPPSAGDALD
jgi:hypothetical protein